MRPLLILVCVAAVLAACAPGMLTAKPVEYDMGNGVKCYTYYQHAVSCLQVK